MYNNKMTLLNKFNLCLTGTLLSSITLFTLTACGGGDNNDNDTGTLTSLNELDINSDFANIQELNRLRFFREIKAVKARTDFNVTGKDVRITIMGEVVDSSHPDIQSRVIKQYNTFSDKGIINIGDANQAYQIDLYGRGDGHGTHVAGTIAAECDGEGIQGVACQSTLDVYDIDTYANKDISIKGWGDIDELERFLESFTAALTNVTKRKESRIVTGSFNIEAPSVLLEKGGPLENLTITQMLDNIEDNVDDLDELISKGLVTFTHSSDLDFLKRVSRNNEGDESIILNALIPKTKQWKALATAIKAYQDNDGVYIITESNYDFENRSSVLNAMPSLSSKVNPELWISAVLVQPTEPGSTKYVAPINSCGQLAKDYCVLIPSYQVLSTMTEKVAEQDDPFYKLDGRGYQVFTGHSMGAPMIAGALALMEELNVRKNLGYSMKDLTNILKENANRSFEGYDKEKHGRGMLDITAALAAM
jgi:subtilisin family serine protease